MAWVRLPSIRDSYIVLSGGLVITNDFRVDRVGELLNLELACAAQEACRRDG